MGVPRLFCPHSPGGFLLVHMPASLPQSPQLLTVSFPKNVTPGPESKWLHAERECPNRRTGLNKDTLLEMFSVPQGTLCTTVELILCGRDHTQRCHKILIYKKDSSHNCLLATAGRGSSNKLRDTVPF